MHGSRLGGGENWREKLTDAITRLEDEDATGGLTADVDCEMCVAHKSIVQESR